MKSRTLKTRLFLAVILLAAVSLACQASSGLSPTATPTSPPTAVPSVLPRIPVEPGEANPQEPVFILGELSYTSPFFEDSLAEPFVLLEDQAGFVSRNEEFEFSLVGQAIGPVSVQGENKLTYSLALPAVPQGTLVDVDNDGQSDSGVQVFAVAYWSNTWGGPFLEKRDGTGWSSAYASTVTDPDRDDEIVGGTLVAWAPDDKQSFPTSFGADGLLFSADDPAGPIPAGYNLVNLDQEPFRVYKEARPTINLIEGDVAINDYSKMSYMEAFDALFEKASREYPFTQDKGIDWQALHDRYAPRVKEARNKEDFYRALRDFAFSIPDAHVGLTIDPDVFFQEYGGGFGLVLAELSDGRVIAAQVLPGKLAEGAGLQAGAEILTWDGQPVSQAIGAVQPGFGPSSTEHDRRQDQVAFLTRVPPGTSVTVGFRNPGASQARQVSLRADVEYDSLFASLPSFQEDQLSASIDAQVLKPSGLGYIRIKTFSDDYNLMAQLWDRYIKELIDNEIPGLIIDVRVNGGGSGEMAFDFAGYFFDQEISLYHGLYFNERTGQFKASEHPAVIKPAPLHYTRPIAVLVGPDCVSACEGFAYAMQQEGRALIVGHTPTAGAFGEVGRGQYKLPEDISFQIPTGRPETLEGKLLIEGTGVIPDIAVPVTTESAMGKTDTVLEAAIQALLDKIQ